MLTAKIASRTAFALTLGLLASACIEENPTEAGGSLNELRSASNAELIGQWTFEPDAETVDATGRWGELVLVGSATVSGGQLHLHGTGTTATGWAHAPGYSGDIIRDKTLVSWVALDDLDVHSGAAMGIDNISGDNFDSVVYGERQARTWMAGSSFLRRTLDVVGEAEAAVGEVMQMAIAYRDLGGGYVEVTICRDGVQLGQYAIGNMTQWTGGNAEILFGKRHTSSLYSDSHVGAIEGRVEEARLYSGALTCAEAGSLVLQPDSDGDGVPDDEDSCEGFDDNMDGDLDGLADGCDSCLGDNGTGDVDGDGVCGDLDLCLGDDRSGDYDGDQAATAARSQGLIDNKERAGIVRAAASTSCN